LLKTGGIDYKHLLQRRNDLNKFKAFFFASPLVDDSQPGYHLLGVEFEMVNFELAGLNLGKIKDVIDKSKERLTCMVNSQDKLMLFVGKIGGKVHVGKTDDGIHGRADLMAHIGQKLGFASFASSAFHVFLSSICKI